MPLEPHQIHAIGWELEMSPGWDRHAREARRLVEAEPRATRRVLVGIKVFGILIEAPLPRSVVVRLLEECRKALAERATELRDILRGG